MRTLIIIAISFLFSYQAQAQHKLYVEQKRGERSLINFGKVGFDNYYFNSSEKCDTLVCSDSGLIDCEIDGFNKLSDNKKELNRVFNKAIKNSIKKIHKSGDSSGCYRLLIKGKNVDIKIFDYKKPGDLKMEITVV